MNDDFSTETGELFDVPKEWPTTAPYSTGEINTAIQKIIDELPIWIKQDEEATISGTTKRKYASLKAVMSVVRPIASKNGIRIRQGCEHAWQLDTGAAKGRMVPIFTDLVHTETGQFERSTVEIPLSKMDAQGMGSAISYGRRYGILNAFGLTTDDADDDGANTKSKTHLEPLEESQELWVLRSELRECETPESLLKWVEKLKKEQRLDRLSEVEAALARSAYSAQQKIVNKDSASKK